MNKLELYTAATGDLASAFPPRPNGVRWVGRDITILVDEICKALDDRTVKAIKVVRVHLSRGGEQVEEVEFLWSEGLGIVTPGTDWNGWRTATGSRLHSAASTRPSEN
jgi:hypothetical protein